MFRLAPVTFVLAAALATDAASQERPYFKRSSEGWFWYEKKPVEPEPVPPEEPQVAPPQVPPEPVTAVNPPMSQPAGPVPGSTAWLRTAIPAALDAATDNPSPENVERYFLLQKEAMDKSESFSEMANIVTTGHPQLDEGRRRPRQDQFAKLLEEEASKKQAEVLKALFSRAALIMFLDKNCSGCALMAENFVRMKSTHGLVWQAVSLDGSLLPESLSSSQSFDAGLAEKLGVEAGGAVFLVAPPDLYVPVTWNATGGSEVAGRLLMVAYRNGLISAEDYHATQPINPMVGRPVAVLSDTPDILREADDLLASRRQRETRRIGQ